MRLTLILFFFFLSFAGRAQHYYWEIGGGLGASNYLGDIGGLDTLGKNYSIQDIKWETTNLTGRVFARYTASQRWKIQFSADYISIKGADSLTTDWPERFARNLSFRNNMFQVSTKFEFRYFGSSDLGRHRRYNSSMDAYIFGGLGLLYHNPQAYYNGEWINLQPLNTEGPDHTYSRIVPTLPIGFGFTFGFKTKHKRRPNEPAGLRATYPRHRITWEVCLTLTPTDYLDDISTVYPDSNLLSPGIARQIYSRNDEVIDDPRTGDIHPANHYLPGSPRGDPTYNDWFLTTQVSYGYMLYSPKRKVRRARHSQYHYNVRRNRKMGRF